MTVDPEERKKIVYALQKIVYDNFYYTQLTNHVAIDAHVQEVDGLRVEARRLLEGLLHVTPPSR